jgi:hypothetical protein
LHQVKNELANADLSDLEAVLARISDAAAMQVRLLAWLNDGSLEGQSHSTDIFGPVQMWISPSFSSLQHGLAHADAHTAPISHLPSLQSGSEERRRALMMKLEMREVHMKRASMTVSWGIGLGPENTLSEVAAGGPASEAGLVVGMHLIEVNGNTVRLCPVCARRWSSTLSRCVRLILKTRLCATYVVALLAPLSRRLSPTSKRVLQATCACGALRKDWARSK